MLSWQRLTVRSASSWELKHTLSRATRRGPRMRGHYRNWCSCPTWMPLSRWFRDFMIVWRHVTNMCVQNRLKYILFNRLYMWSGPESLASCGSLRRRATSSWPPKQNWCNLEAWNIGCLEDWSIGHMEDWIEDIIYEVRIGRGLIHSARCDWKYDDKITGWLFCTEAIKDIALNRCWNT